MGYSTEFEGEFSISPPLKEEHLHYLVSFSGSRRMKRTSSEFNEFLRDLVGLPPGEDGEYCLNSEHLDYNLPPGAQPGLWCQWIPTEDGTELIWDGGEKFYNYIEWLEYLIEHFFLRWGYELNGTMLWRGEDFHDIGKILVEDNKVSVSSLS